MNIITADKTYATVKGAENKLDTELSYIGKTREDVRYLIGVKVIQNVVRFVPTLVGTEYIGFAHRGIMVVS
jgi:hypothetical protein